MTHGTRTPARPLLHVEREGSNLLHVLLLEEHGKWISQGLEIDICAQGNDLDEAKKRFLLTLEAEMAAAGNRDLRRAIGSAPEWFYDKWALADEAHVWTVEY